jgi:lipid-binding SYLF domain-containing protein
MKSLLLIAFILMGSPEPALRAQTGPGDVDTAQGSAEKRLVKAAAALQTFRERAAGPARTLLERALCVGVAPRRDPDETASNEKGFFSCRPDRNAAWSNPAAIAIEGGGTFWRVSGVSFDLILLATNQATASHFADREGFLGSPNLGTVPGPVRQDQIPLLNNHTVLFAYEQSATGITGLNIAGASMSEDKATNSILYGRELTNLAIVRGSVGERRPAGVAVFLAALSSSGAGQSNLTIEAQCQ